MDYQTAIVERKDHIGSITLNHPQVLNILNLQLAKDINSALLELEAARDIYVIIIKGAGCTFCAGERAFCAGADIKDALPFAKEHRYSPWAMPPIHMRGLNMKK